jgi:transcription elongation factor GreA
MEAILDKIPMTIAGYELLNRELKHLKSVERPAVIQAISEARSHGDLSENAEYDAAKERQGLIEGRVRTIEDKIARAQVIDPAKLNGNTVKFGATIRLVDEDDVEVTYAIVGVEEANIDNGLISISSPIARAMIGRSEGDWVEVQTPGGIRGYEVLGLEFKTIEGIGK